MVQHITVLIKETPNLIQKIYHSINTPAKCFYCGKPAHYLQIVTDKQKHLLTRKVCHTCEVSRRKK